VLERDEVSLEQVRGSGAARLSRGMESHYTGGYKSPARQRRRGDVLAAYKYIRGVNTGEAEELFKLEDGAGVGTDGWEFIPFSLGG